MTSILATWNPMGLSVCMLCVALGLVTSCAEDVDEESVGNEARSSARQTGPQHQLLAAEQGFERAKIVIRRIAADIEGLKKTGAHPELVEFDAAKCVHESDNSVSLTYKYRAKKMRGAKVQSVEEGGCVIAVVVNRQEGQVKGRSLRNLGLEVIHRVRVSNTPSEGFEERVRSIIGSHLDELDRLDQATASGSRPTKREKWKQGETVELTGTIYPSKGGVGKHYIDGAKGSAHLRSADIDKVVSGTTLWVKGTVEYVHYERPDDYYAPNGSSRYSAMLPQTICSIHVDAFKILEWPPGLVERRIRDATTRRWPGEDYPKRPGLSEDVKRGIEQELMSDPRIGEFYFYLGAKKSRSIWHVGIEGLTETKAVWCLVSGLCHPHDDVQIGCAQALGELRDKRVVPFMLIVADAFAVFGKGSESATLHSIFQHALTDSLNNILGTSVALRDGQGPEGLKKGIAIWKKALEEEPVK